MDKEKLKHMLTRRSTWAIIVSTILFILNTSGAFDAIQLDRYRIISYAIISALEALGIIHMYKTEPLKEYKSKLE